MPAPMFIKEKHCGVCRTETTHQVSINPGVWEIHVCLNCGQTHRFPYIHKLFGYDSPEERRKPKDFNFYE